MSDNRPFPDFTYNPADPLARCNKETKRANTALNDYWLMTNGNSLRKLAQMYLESQTPTPTKDVGTLAGWSKRYRWQERIEVQRGLIRAAANAKWIDRQAEIKERDYSQAEQLRSLADKIIEEGPRFIHSTRRIVKGQRNEKGEQLEPDREIITIALDGHLLVKALETASELQRKASGMDSKTPVLNIDIKSLSDAQLRRLADGEDIFSVLASPG